MKDDDAHFEPPVDGQPDIEPGYLRRERLQPDEIASIERALASASDSAVRRRSNRWLGFAAVAATLVAMVLLLARSPTEPVAIAPGATPRAARPPAMVLEIQRTDVADARPYKLIIQLETGEESVRPEVQP